ncbi:DUF4430 domain-containing protein [Weizmannia coagulans]|uniref:Transcobalamin-like C-terminal domain-containing protein n=3 Tax=Heyndrickxia TaxID=2837504 RepID=G2TJA5_HEYCO|nr:MULTISPECIES: DUF4430 domain-containing protein [Heyndrickxia]AEP00868.1 hypothetical protein Bcoa_1673 [Heyndrickxia coagulans 36D1]AJO21290.1 hypothetical protein SB48_HM08orf00758 [Heyndrickxia coagulans]AKN53076.1 hypothetical protein AB434_0671 [Heyndrickxia coagulans]APB37429.1 hypothetical protein BIZ35_11875 [Heyndrickxia coagulans]ATW81908.1 DUF4430 domain-containing protein [Heyndrickxia coagulans]
MKYKSMIIDSIAVLLIAFGAWFLIDGFHFESKTVKTYSETTQVANTAAKEKSTAAKENTSGKKTDDAGSIKTDEKSNTGGSGSNVKDSAARSKNTEAKASTDSKTDETPATNTKTAVTSSTSTKTTTGASSSGSNDSRASDNTGASSKAKAETVSLTVKGYKGPVFGGKYSYKSGDTAFSVLKTATASEGVSVDYSGSGATAYVKGIDGQYEGDQGGMSGWKYKVNGKEPNVSAGTYKLKAGDQVVWFYSK